MSMDVKADYLDVYRECGEPFRLFEITPVQDLRFGRKVLKAGDSFHVPNSSNYDSPFDNGASELLLRLKEMGFDYKKGKCNQDAFAIEVRYLQRRCAKDVLRPIYIKHGGNTDYYDLFYRLYDNLYDILKYQDYASGKAFRGVLNAIRWYGYYKMIGHCDEWCWIAAEYNYPHYWDSEKGWNSSWHEGYEDKEINARNDSECLQLCMKKCPDEQEFQLHDEYILGMQQKF